MYSYRSLQSKTKESQLLILVLCLGLFARLAYMQFSENIIHPDEIIQYAEQAHAQIFGYGLEPWEYRFGVRSWFLPTAISSILALLNQIGITEPQIYINIVRLTASVASCSLILSCYQITRNCFPNSRLSPLIASLTAAFWIELIVYAPRATPEVLASYALCGAIALTTKYEPSQKDLIISGILIGLTAGLRYQYLPPIAILSIFYAKRYHSRQFFIFTIGILSSSLAIALSDIIRWGNPLKPIVNNFKLNAIEGVSSTFGIESWQFYIEQLVSSSIYLVIFSIILIYPLSAWLFERMNENNQLLNPLKQQNNPLTKSQVIENRLILAAIILSIIASHSAVPHKELRFTFAVIPITICLISGASSRVLGLLSKRVMKANYSFPKTLQAILTFSLITFTGILLSHGWPNNYVITYYRNLLVSSEPLIVTKYLRSIDNMTSILRLDASRGYAGGYYYLHLKSRLYGQQNIENIEPDQFHKYFSHIVVKTGSKVPTNFQKIKRFSSSTIYSNNLIESKDLLLLKGYDKIFNRVDFKYKPTDFK